MMVLHNSFDHARTDEEMGAQTGMLNLLRGLDFNVACSLACSFKQTEGVPHEEDFGVPCRAGREFLVVGQFPIMRAGTDGQPRVFNCLGYQF